MKKKIVRLVIRSETLQPLARGLDACHGGSNSACDSICNMITCNDCPLEA